MGKTLIAIPCMDSVPSLFANSLAMLQKVGDVSLAMEMSSLIYHSRNHLAGKAISLQADYILWLDSDMVFHPDLLQKMMSTMLTKNLDILTGVYYRRVAPYTPVLLDTLEIDSEKKSRSTPTTHIPDELFEVAGCGFGCVLMTADVLYDVLAKFGPPFNPIGGVGEDLSFCWRARQCGYKIWADPSLWLGHVGKITVSKEFVDAYGEKK